MAKALPGFAVGPDPRVTHRLADENRLLKRRIADLEAAVLRLQVENEALAALREESSADVLELA